VKHWLITLVMALVCPLIIIEAWWGVRGLQDARNDAASVALHMAEATSVGIERELERIEQLLVAMAGVVSRDVFSEGVDPAGSGWCQRRVARIVEVYPLFDNVVLTGPDASVLCAYLELADSLPHAAPHWWDEFRVRPRFRVGDPLQSPSTNTWVLPFAVPLTSASGDFGGALVAEIELIGLFGGLVQSEGFLVTVASSDRVVIARSDDAKSHIGRRLPAMTGSDEPLGEGRAFASGPDIGGVDRTWGQVELPSGWTVYVGLPEAAVLVPAWREWLANLSITLGVLVPALLIAGYLIRRIDGWRDEAVQGIRQASAGKTIQIPSGVPSELVAVFDQLNESVEARKSEVRALTLRANLFDSASVGIYTSTPDGRFLEVNAAFVSMMGYDTPQNLIEAGPAALYADPRRRASIVEKVMAWGAESPDQLKGVEGEYVSWVRADGSSLTVRLSGGPVRVAGDDGDEVVFQMFAQDVTQERDRQDALRRSQKLEAIGRLAGGIAHDFNNLLTVIRGYLELLEDEVGGDGPLPKSLSEISKATERAASLTRRLLVFGGRSGSGAEISDCNEVVIGLQELAVPLLPANVTVKTEIGEGPYPVAVAAGDVEQLLLNLMLNARDAMPLGGTIWISTKAAPGRSENEDAVSGVKLTVTDNGSGMEPAIAGRIFEPFFTTKPMGVGTGLGLSTAYGLVSRAGGSMHVQSAAGKGTTMEIWLPLADLPVTVDEPTPEVPMAGDETVLVVEDDEQLRDFVVRALSGSGYRVLAAANGLAALEQVRSEAETIHLVLSDVVMPEMGGVELAEQLKKITPHTPVLFMTGYVEDPLVVAELERRADRVLFKPFSGSEVCRWVRGVLDPEVRRRAR